LSRPANIPQAPLERTESGVAATGQGWFVLNARDARWHRGEGRGARLGFEGDTEFPQVGVNLFVLGPGETMGMYHWESDQEDFLVLSGAALLIIEGEERPLRKWDFVHCPVGTSHVIVGAGEAPCAVLAIGARAHQAGAGWGAYSVDETAIRHGVGVERETNDPREAYERFPDREPARWSDDWLPDD
jgi:uncharacterized cupin superfamily protein